MMRRALFGLPAAFLGVTSPGDKLRRPQNAPYGQQTPIGVQPGSPSIVVAHIIIVPGASTGGVFVYSGTPGPGNLPIAWMTNGLTDPYGNALPSPGIVSRSGVNTVVMNNGVFQLQVSGTTWFDLVPANSPGGGTAGQVTVGDFWVPSPARIFAGGKIVFDTVPDTTLGLSGTSLTAHSTTASWLFDMPVQAITALQPGTTATKETWHSMTLLNSWANNVSFTASRYRLMPDNSVRVQGVINATAATAATFFTLPAGYIPSSASGAPVGCNAGAGANTVPTLRWDTSGNLTINNLAIPSASAVFFTQDIPLD